MSLAISEIVLGPKLKIHLMKNFLKLKFVAIRGGAHLESQLDPGQ